MHVHTNDSGNSHAFNARKRVVIFDFDGTLADSIGWFFGVLNDVARRYDFRQITAEQREELRRKPPLDILNALEFRNGNCRRSRCMRALAAQDIDQIKLFGWVGDLLLELKVERSIDRGGQLQLGGEYSVGARPACAAH